ncbi:1873_t:CDS:1, partial [Funneliformis geosporum]
CTNTIDQVKAKIEDKEGMQTSKKKTLKDVPVAISPKLSTTKEDVNPATKRSNLPTEK